MFQRIFICTFVEHKESCEGYRSPISSSAVCFCVKLEVKMMHKLILFLGYYYLSIKGLQRSVTAKDIFLCRQRYWDHVTIDNG